MSYEFRMPNVNGKTTEEQMQQVISYLRQLVQELNYVVLPFTFGILNS